jgi:hypothetical protein
MQIGCVDIGFVGHVTFLFRSPGGTVLLTDPYFNGSFPWEHGTETHLQRSDVRPASITTCDAIFVSHIHGDRCDLDAIREISGRAGALVVAPPDVCDRLASDGLGADVVRPIEDGAHLTVGDVALTCLGGYDNSFDDRKRMNKFSLLATCGDTKIWYSGDCHHMPPALAGTKVDAAFSWTSPDAVDGIAALRPPPARLVVTHHDLHEPGHFWCSRDPEAEARSVSEKMPGTEVIVPDRLGSFQQFLREKA